MMMAPAEAVRMAMAVRMSVVMSVGVIAREKIKPRRR